MRNHLTLWMIAAFLVFTGCNKYDDEIDQLNQDITSVDNEVQQLAQQMLALQDWQKQVNTDIQSLKTIVSALEKKDYVTSVEPTADGAGYVITFQNSGILIIHHGKDGKTPTISVKQAEDGLYYWTVDGEWLTDAAGQKIPTTGEDGENGKDAIAPQVRINSTANLWEISTDGGNTWTSTGVKATGPQGEKGDTGTAGSDGSSGDDGDSFFKSVVVNGDNVTFTLSDNTTFTLPLNEIFVNRIQSIVFIPKYTDEKATVTHNATTQRWEVELDFFITPKEVVANIVEDNLSMNAIYTISRGVTLYDMPVTSLVKDAENGIITVTASCENLADFASGTTGASAFLMIDDGNSKVVSENVPLVKTTSQTGITYTFNSESGALKIEGRGAMSSEPWNTVENRALIKTVEIAEGITSIGGGAFMNCTSLESVTIPLSVTSIESNAFRGCTSLRNISIPLSVTSIGGSAFMKCTSLEDVTIPLSVTSIGSYAFNGCTSLRDISIPLSVTEIGGFAFSDCTSLTNVTIPSSVTKIVNYTFSSCTSLSSIIIPSSVTEIGSAAFNDCSALATVTCNAVTPPDMIGSAFENNANGRIIYVPSGSVDAYKRANKWSDYASDIQSIR